MLNNFFNFFLGSSCFLILLIYTKTTRWNLGLTPRIHFLEGELIQWVDKIKSAWIIAGQFPTKAGWQNAHLALQGFSQSIDSTLNYINSKLGFISLPSSSYLFHFAIAGVRLILQMIWSKIVKYPIVEKEAKPTTKTNNFGWWRYFNDKKLSTPSFWKSFYSAAVKKQCCNHFFRHPMFYRVFIISFPNILFVLKDFNIPFSGDENLRYIVVLI